MHMKTQMKGDKGNVTLKEAQDKLEKGKNWIQHTYY